MQPSLEDWIASDLVSIHEWCLKNSIDVEMKPGRIGVTLFNFGRPRIVLGRRLNKITLVCVFLHECGHVLIDKTRLRNKGDTIFNTLAARPHPDRNGLRRIRFKIDTIDEELEAWKRGWKLAKRLNLGISKAAYDRAQSLMINRYVHWASRTSGKVSVP